MLPFMKIDLDRRDLALHIVITLYEKPRRLFSRQTTTTRRGHFT